MQSQPLAVLNAGFGQSRLHFLQDGPVVGPSIGRLMAKLWPFRTYRRTGPTLGSPCFRSSIPQPDACRHRKIRTSIMALLSRPTARAVAFVRGIAPGVVEDLYIVPTAGGEPKRLTFDNAWLFGPPTWTADGRDLVFSSWRGGLPSLWRRHALPAAGIESPRPAGHRGVFQASV